MSRLTTAYVTRAFRLRVPLPCEPRWIDQQVEAAADAGYNTVILDAFFGGFTCFPSQSTKQFGLPKQHSLFKRLDLLDVASRACYAHHVRLVACMDCLDAGRRENWPRSPLTEWKFRSWRAAGPRGVLGNHAECASPKVLLCPSNGDVVDFLGSLAVELVDAYPVHGLLLRGIQFGPEVGPHIGRCFCVACSTPDSGELGDRTDAATWDKYRLKQVSELITAIKARARHSRRSLRIWGEFPVLPGPDSPPEMIAEEFDQELFDVDVIPVNADGTQRLHSAGVELASFTAQNEEEIVRCVGGVEQFYPMGYVCRWNSRAILNSEKLEAHLSPVTSAVDTDPLLSARAWLESSAREDDGDAGKRAGQCLTLWDAAANEEELPLDKMHSLIEAALPHEGAEQDARQAMPLARAFALLRLAIMVRD